MLPTTHPSRPRTSGNWEFLREDQRPQAQVFHNRVFQIFFFYLRRDVPRRRPYYLLWGWLSVDVEGSYAKGMMKFSSAGYVSDAEDGPWNSGCRRGRDVREAELHPSYSTSSHTILLCKPQITDLNAMLRRPVLLYFFFCDWSQFHSLIRPHWTLH